MKAYNVPSLDNAVTAMCRINLACLNVSIAKCKEELYFGPWKGRQPLTSPQSLESLRGVFGCISSIKTKRILETVPGHRPAGGQIGPINFYREVQQYSARISSFHYGSTAPPLGSVGRDGTDYRHWSLGFPSATE
jgi:hypothetical protein